MLTLLLLTLTASAGDLDEVLAKVAPHRSAREAPAPTIPARAYAKAEQGDVAAGVDMVEGTAAGKVWAVTVFDQPVEALWMAVNDEEAAAALLPVSTSQVVAGHPYRHGRLIFEHLPVRLAADRWWVAEQHHSAHLYRTSEGLLWELAWTTVDGASALAAASRSDLAEQGIEIAWAKGAWLLVPLEDGRTLGEYFNWSDPGGSLPAGPVSRLGRGSVVATVEAMGELASGYTIADRQRFVRPDGSPLAAE